MFAKKTFEFYLWRTILPYFLLSWLLLTVILFLQQGSRFSEILFGANVPPRLLLELSAALMVSVVAFTGPMALLAGIVIGIGQMRGDSELTAMQAAGVGSRTILLPCLLGGLVVSAFALLINLRGVPLAAGMIRRVAVETALLKLDSPIEPGVFNTEFSNYVIYVRDGNNEQGVWEKVFIYLPQKDGQVQLITARSGRIDSAENQSELVLTDAQVTTLPSNPVQQPVTLDRVNLLRVALDTGRRQLRQKLESVERVPEEMGLFELADFARQKTGKERIEAEILWHRRLALSFAPLFLAFLGVAVSLQFGRGGRGWASARALAILILYYLLSLLGEQSARAGLVPTLFGGWLATMIVGLTAVYLLRGSSRRIQGRLKLPALWPFGFRRPPKDVPVKAANARQTSAFSRFEFGLFGLLERDFLQNLFWYFVFTSLALVSLFHVFTVFEVLKGVTSNARGVSLLLKYLLLLTPLVLWQIAPTALMIAVLTTYAVKARQNETIIWGAAGQSIYVLILPSVLLAALIGLVNWELQEKILPLTNPRQDVLRTQLRGGTGGVGSQEGRFWVAGNEGIYSFVAAKGSDNATARDVSLYQFTDNNERLQKVFHTESAAWFNSNLILGGQTWMVSWEATFVKIAAISESEGGQVNLTASDNPFSQIGLKPAQLNSKQLEKLIETADSPSEARRLEVALQKKYATLFMPLVIVFFSTPLALSRRGRQGSLSFALGAVVMIWLLLTTAVGLFETFGNEGMLPPIIAVWSPLIVFSSVGWYLLAKAKS